MRTTRHRRAVRRSLKKISKKKDKTMATKKAIESKTMWVATATAMVGTAIQFIPTLQTIIPAHYYGAIMAGLGFLFAGLRAVTNKPLEGV